jgi:beta-glucosidase
VLWVWYPGQEGGHAVAKVLFGDVSPSGRLPITFPRSVDDLPDYHDYAMAGRTYRYSRAEPLYPFGFGLSYTRFRYSRLKLSEKRIKAGKTITAEVTITNTGKRKGDEVVQLYLRRPQGRPWVALRDFKRVTIAPGRSKAIRFKLTPEMMSTFDDRGEPIGPSGRMELIIAGAAPIDRSVLLGSSRPVRSEFIIIKPVTSAPN